MSPARRTSRPARRRSSRTGGTPGKQPSATKRARGLAIPSGYDGLRDDVVRLIRQARHASVRAVNAVMTATYWLIGRHIVRFEQEGRRRAAYGERLLAQLGEDLTRQCGRGFGLTNLRQMRAFYLAYEDMKIRQTASGEFTPEGSWRVDSRKRQALSGESDAQSSGRKFQTSSGKFDLLPVNKARSKAASGLSVVQVLAERFPLPWSAYVRLLSVADPQSRRFYEQEALRGGWTIRQLDRQIDSMFYERTALSRNKAAMLTKGARALPSDKVTPQEAVKDPFVLEFLGLRDEYSENDLEEALILHLERFLLELGGEFAFVGRQRRLRVGDQWYRIDLLFYHRRLRCLIVIDLKTGWFTHADAGQMHLYLNYAREHWMMPGGNPPVGLIPCAQRDAAVAHYSLDNLPSKVLAAEYRTTLPDPRVIADEMSRTRQVLQGQVRPAEESTK